MKMHLLIYAHSPDGTETVGLQKTFESIIRPFEGDVIEDPGFSPQYYNGYEVVKVGLNYETDECWVSLAPLDLELTEIPVSDYIERLLAHGWQVVQ